MPTYQYECDACHHAFEILQSMTEKKLKKCPKCGKSTLQRLIGTGSGIIFKGSGFYETDYKRKDTPKDSSKADSASSASKPGSCGPGCGCH
jgi:putative FmdB family regulatory protein